MGTHTVLIVEDDESIARLYKRFLSTKYDVEVETTAEGATNRVISDTKPAVDAILLDRRLPDGEGADVLESIRDQKYDCRVAMVTGVEPDFDIIGMGFDLYVVKPVSRDELIDAVETLLVRGDYDGLLQEAAALASKRALLESEKDREELINSSEYTELLSELDTLDEELLKMAEGLTAEDYRVMFRDLGEQTKTP
ncbi:response regulator [Halorubraceae archaeon YAN]|nr:response regulator [Halorubraceae archaeon YAN]